MVGFSSSPSITDAMSGIVRFLFVLLAALSCCTAIKCYYCSAVSDGFSGPPHNCSSTSFCTAERCVKRIEHDQWIFSHCARYSSLDMTPSLGCIKAGNVKHCYCLTDWCNGPTNVTLGNTLVWHFPPGLP